MSIKHIVIGSRGSDLALWQANHIKTRLEIAGASVEIKIYKTQGDQIQHLSLDKLEGKGFFTKELEDALLKREIDLAVHSHKDLPTISPEGLCIAAVTEREDPSELIIINKNAVDHTQIFEFKSNAVIGTSSARRKSQLKSFRSDCIIKDIRGNVPTRVKKLKDGVYDAILLAKAGISRLNLDLTDFHTIEIDPTIFVPAPAQGVLALQTRSDDASMIEFLKCIHQEEVAACIQIERSILNLFNGGCHMPLGAYATHRNNAYELWVSKSDTEHEIPSRLFLSAQDSKGLDVQAVNILKSNNIHGKSIFISKEVSDDSLLVKTLQAEKASLLFESGIHTSAIDFELPDLSKIDIVFFNSKNAVNYFFEKLQSIPSHIKFACYGWATEIALKLHNCTADFVGTSSDPSIVAKQFNEKYTSTQNIFSPISSISKKSIQELLKDRHSMHSSVVYTTTEKPMLQLPDADVYIFTSPSNVRAFSSSFEKLTTKKVIAIGTITNAELIKHSIHNAVVSQRSDELALIEAIQTSFIK